MNACTKKHDDAQPAPVADNSINDLFASNRNASQNFTINCNKDTTVVGSKGTKVHIGAGTLHTSSGQVATGNVTINLKEVIAFSDMILNNAPTISQNRLLISGGEFYIQASQNGTSLTLAPDASYYITVPAPKGATNSMNIFTGRDSSGTITWSPVNADTVNSNMNATSNTAMQRVSSSMNFQDNTWGISDNINEYVVRCTALGWINCDYFDPNEVICSVTTSCAPSNKTTCAKAFFTVPATNSMGNLTINSNLDFTSNNLPDNTLINIVVINHINGKFNICIMKHTVNCSTNMNIADLQFTEMDLSKIDQYLTQINL
jgi:hemin uptake protein HemP